MEEKELQALDPYNNYFLVSAGFQMKTLIAIFATVVTLSINARADANFVNGVRAVVGDAVITQLQVEMSAAPAIELLKQRYGSQPELFLKKAAETFNEALEQLIERQLILHEFKTAGYNLPESFIEKVIEERIRSDYGTRTTLIKTLQAQGTTYEKYRQQIREQIIIQALLGKNISSAVMISPQKIQDYYSEHREKFKVGDAVKLRMIALDSSIAATPESRRKLAEEILRKIKEGATFEEMAMVYSTGSQRNEGGAWGWVERSVLRKDLADVAFSLEPGKLSDVIETPDECYLMLVEDKRPAHIRPLSEVRDEIEKTLLVEERARLQKQWLERLKAKTFVRYF